MAKLTPAVSRMAAVLELLSRDPSREWSLSEIVCELGISRSTAHALLVSLDLANFLYRNEAKRYVLGPLAVSVGRAAIGYFSPAELIQRELAELSREWGVICATNYRHRDAVLIREWVDPVRLPEESSRAGRLIPLSPPWGAIFLAWDSPAQQRSWIARLPESQIRGGMAQTLAQGLEDIREKGFMCAIRTDQLQMECVGMNWEPSRQYTDHFAVQPDPGGTHTVDYLAAPVFDWRGRIAFSISVTGFDRRLTGENILAMADELMARCRKLGRFLDQARAIATD